MKKCDTMRCLHIEGGMDRSRVLFSKYFELKFVTAPTKPKAKHEVAFNDALQDGMILCCLTLSIWSKAIWASTHVVRIYKSENSFSSTTSPCVSGTRGRVSIVGTTIFCCVFPILQMMPSFYACGICSICVCCMWIGLACASKPARMDVFVLFFFSFFFPIHTNVFLFNFTTLSITCIFCFQSSVDGYCCVLSRFSFLVFLFFSYSHVKQYFWLIIFSFSLRSPSSLVSSYYLQGG